MKKEMGNSMGGMVKKMMGIFGLDPRDLLTDEQIDQLLVATFNKFDKDGSGQLELPEFHKAWSFLGLKGDAAEVDAAFRGVDVDSSGIVERPEFIRAIKNSRLAELSLTVLLEQMDGHLEGLESFFDDYKAKVEEANWQSAAHLDSQEAAYK